MAFRAFITFRFGLLGLYFLSFWPFGPLFPSILPFWAFISFSFGLLGLHFLSFWPFRPSFPFILAFWAFISFHFGLLGLHFLSFWPFGPSFLSFWSFGPSFPSCLLRGARGAPPTSCQKRSFSKFWPFGLQFLILAFWDFRAFITFRFGLLGLYFLSIWPFGPSFPSILPFWGFISFSFGLLGLHFLSFWPFGPSFALLGLHFLSFWPFGPSFALLGLHFLSLWLVWAAAWAPLHKLSKMARFLHVPHEEFNSARSGSILQFLTFWGFISFYFGLFGLYCFVFAFWGFFFYFVQNRLRTRADQSPSPWPTKPGENSAKPPTGRPRSKPMGHQTWRKLHAYGSSVEKTAKGQTKVQTHGPPNLEKIARLRQQCRRDRQRADQSPISISQLTCFKMRTVRCSARQCTLGRSHVLEGLTPKLNPKPVKVKMRVERQRGRDTQKQSERAMKGGACQPTNSPPYRATTYGHPKP